MKKSKVLAAVISAVLVFSSLSPASPGRDKGGYDRHGDPSMMQSGSAPLRFADELKLSDAQKEKLRNLKDSKKRKVSDIRHEIRKLRWDIQDEFKKKKPSKTAINASIDKISAYQKELMMIGAGQMLEIRSILTEEQFAKMTTLIETGKEKSSKRFFDKFRDKK